MNRRRVFLALLILSFIAMTLACGGGGGGGGGGGEPQPVGQPGGGAPQKNNVVPGAQNAPQEDPKVTAANDDRAINHLVAKAEAAQLAKQKVFDAEVKRLKDKYESDLKNQDATVERLKTEYKNDLAKFKADKIAFDKAVKAYKPLRDEFDATNKLTLARAFYDAKDANAANRRFEEIVKLYPGTKAADDANKLLNGRYVEPRKSTVEPVRPVEPVEPRLTLPDPPRLVLPTAPTIVPTEELRRTFAEQIRAERERSRLAAAQAKLNSENNARAEAERKAREEHDENGLVLLHNTVSSSRDTAAIYVTGTVVNRRSKTLTYAQITFNVYDESGAQVGSALANVNGLEPGGQWSFKAIYLGNRGTSYKFSKLSGF